MVAQLFYLTRYHSDTQDSQYNYIMQNSLGVIVRIPREGVNRCCCTVQLALFNIAEHVEGEWISSTTMNALIQVVNGKLCWLLLICKSFQFASSYCSTGSLSLFVPLQDSFCFRTNAIFSLLDREFLKEWRKKTSFCFESSRLALLLLLLLARSFVQLKHGGSRDESCGRG